VRPSKALEGGVNDSPVVPDYYALYGQHTVDGDDTYDLAFFVGPMHVLLVERAPQHKEKGTLSTCHELSALAWLNVASHVVGSR